MTERAQQTRSLLVDDDDRLLDRKDFSEWSGLSERTIARFPERGDGPPYIRLGRRRIAYRLGDLKAWAAGRKFTSRAAELGAAI